MYGSSRNWALRWNWLKFEPAVLKGWNVLTYTPMHILRTGTSTGEYRWKPIFECRPCPTTNRSIGQAEILALPCLSTKIIVFCFDLEESVQLWLTFHLLSQVLEVELLVAIVGIAGQHVKAIGLKTSLTRFNQEETFTCVIFWPKSVVLVEFPKLIIVAGTFTSIWRSFRWSQIGQTPATCQKNWMILIGAILFS